MEMELSQSLMGGIGVSTPTMVPETATQRWRRVVSSQVLMNRKPSPPKLEMFRVAVLIIHALNHFTNGIDNLDDVDRQVEERTEEANVASRYHCNQCRHVVSVAADVEIKRPVCRDVCIKKCCGANSRFLATSSEPEHSASDYDGHSAVIVQPPSDQIVPDIVDDAYGLHSNMSGDHVTIYGFPNLSQSLLHSGISNTDIATYTPNHVSLTLNTGTNMSSDQPQQGTRNISCIWIAMSATGLGLEAVSAYLDQVATQQKLHYAFYGMLLSIVAVFVCLLDLIHNAVKQRGASASDMLWGILPEVFGLALACIQCITSALQYGFLRRHATYPVKVSLVPFLCFFILFAFKYKNERN